MCEAHTTWAMVFSDPILFVLMLVPIICAIKLIQIFFFKGEF